MFLLLNPGVSQSFAGVPPGFCWLIPSTQLRSLASYHCFLVKVPTNAAYIAILPLNILNTKYHILMMLKMVKHG